MELAEEFLERHRAGQRPALREYVERYPELAAEIRAVFPAMAMMEQIALADESLEGDPTGAAPAAAAPPPQQFGDYRVLREIGRGGMGVVYEAEQVSLGRHVALKVLPPQMLGDVQRRRRFEREARAAAKLHHTNIVPVFGMGEHGETPYFVMQFIQGQGLDAVLDELRRLRAGTPPQNRETAVPVPATRRDISAADVARSLLTGGFDPQGSYPFGPADGRAITIAPADAPAVEVVEAGAARVLVPLLSPASPALPGSAPRGSAKAKRPTYWQGVARIGAQVADALAYAHGQGVVHRDVKPSNLLLDTQGTVWITDFGLAKADDQANLTHTGDLLGTLRYMPPEAFEGKSDARGDIYSLGLTLYELLAFRPAFDEKERGRLVRQVTQEAPARLASVNAEVPRDLETIVQKAIERDPAHRYASASELAADLQRYLDDEPIAARRTSPAERLGRWARRNPMVASLGGAVFLLLAVLAVGSTVAAWRIDREKVAAENAARREADAARRAGREATRATQALAAEETANAGLRAAQRQVRAALYASELNLLQFAWKEDNLAFARELLGRTEPKPGESDLRGFEWWYWQHEMRGELRSLKLPTRFPVESRVVPAAALSSDGGRVASYGRTASGRDFRLDVCDTTSGRELFERLLPFRGGMTLYPCLALDRSGARLAAAWVGPSPRGNRPPPLLELRVWDLFDGRTLLSVSERGVRTDSNNFGAIALCGNGTRVALALNRNRDAIQETVVKVWDVKDGQEIWHASVAGVWAPYGLTIGEHGATATLALVERSRTRRTVLRAWTVPEGKETLNLTDAASFIGLAVRPDGDRIAVIRSETGRTAAIRILHTTSGRTHANIELGERFGSNYPSYSGAALVRYSPDGTRIAAVGGGRSPRVRVWDAETGVEELALCGLPDGFECVGFRGDGSRLIAMGVDTIREWEVSAGRAPSGARWLGLENAPLSRSRGVIPAGAGLPLPDASLLALSDNGSRVAIVALNRDDRLLPQVTVLDTSTGGELARYSKALPRGPSIEPLSYCCSVVFSLDGARLAAWPKKPFSSQPSTSPFISSGIGVSVAIQGGQAVVRSIDVGGPADRDGRLREGDVLIGRQREDGGRDDFAGRGLGEITAMLFGPRGSRIRLVVRPRGTDRLITYDLTHEALAREWPGSRLIAIWDALSGEGRSVPVMEPGLDAEGARVEQVVFQPDGSRLAVLLNLPAARRAPGGRRDRETRVLIRDAGDGRLVGSWAVPATTLTALAYSPEGRTLAAAGETQSGRTRARQILLLDPADGRVLRSIPTTAGVSLDQLRYSPDGRAIAGLGGGQRLEVGYLAVWNPAEGRQSWSIHRFSSASSNANVSLPVRPALAFSPDGRRVCMAFMNFGRLEVRLWDAATGHEVMTLIRDGSDPQGLAFDRAGRRMFLALANATFNPASAARLLVLDAPPVSPELQAADLIDAPANNFALHSERRARLESDTRIPAEVRAAVPRVLEGRAESVAHLRDGALDSCRRPHQPVAEYQDGLRLAEAAARQRGDDATVLAALAMALARLGRRAEAALCLDRARTRIEEPEWPNAENASALILEVEAMLGVAGFPAYPFAPPER
jgi:serine/threonine protein kinase/WD40 repeat protein